MTTRLLALALTTVALAGLARGQAPVGKNGLRWSVEAPKGPVTVAQVSRGEAPIRIVFTNAGFRELVLWPYVNLEVRDALGQTVAESTKSGRWGESAPGPVLEQIPFVILRKDDSHRLDVNLANYTSDAEAIKGWTLKPGDYTLVFTYHYDPAATKKKFGRGVRNLDNAGKMWNRALPGKEEREVRIKVRTKV